MSADPLELTESEAQIQQESRGEERSFFLALMGAYCPMGCGQTLVIEGFAHRKIACESPDCPRPYAVMRILADPETEHILELNATDFSLQHPLRERLEGDLFKCVVTAHIQGLDGPPAPPGCYRVFWNDDEDGCIYEPSSRAKDLL